MPDFSGLGAHLGNLWMPSKAKTRVITSENPTGAKGKGAMSEDGPAAHRAAGLGRGWKIAPYVRIKPEETAVIADIKGPGAVKHLWFTLDGYWRHTILRIYWDDSETASVECPLGDFFACGWNSYARVASLPVCVNPANAFNCYWEMPFRRRCKITVTNVSNPAPPSKKEFATLIFFEIAYVETEVPKDALYFHAQFRRTNPVPFKEPYVILDGVEGEGAYAGTYMAWGVNNNGWWGEGEFKFFLDGDKEFPSIVYTGTEDYFCGSFNWDLGNPWHGMPVGEARYQEHTGPYCGVPQVIRPDGLYSSQQRFGLYRWHIMDPIRFEKDIRAIAQPLGWRRDGRYLPLQDDIASVAYWYQTHPARPFPPLPGRDRLEII